jgi:hypothetical protein
MMILFLLVFAADSEFSLRGLLVQKSGSYFGKRGVRAPESAIFQEVSIAALKIKTNNIPDPFE